MFFLKKKHNVDINTSRHIQDLTVGNYKTRMKGSEKLKSKGETYFVCELGMMPIL